MESMPGKGAASPKKLGRCKFVGGGLRIQGSGLKVWDSGFRYFGLQLAVAIRGMMQDCEGCDFEKLAPA